jgi:uncharacterized protein
MKRTWLTALLVVPLVLIGWWRLRLETDILATLPAAVPEVKALKLLRDGFAGGSDLLIAVEAEDEMSAEGAVEEIADRLVARHDLVKEVRRAQGVMEESGRGVELLAWALQNAAPEKLRALQERLQGAAAEQQLKQSLEVVGTSLDAERVQRALYDPLGLLNVLGPLSLEGLEGTLFGLVSEDGAFRVLLVTPNAEVGNYRAAEAWLQQVKAEVHVPEGVVVRFSGEPAFQAEIGAGIERDMTGTIGMTEFLIALLFWLMFRRLKPLLWIQGLLLLSMAITLGLGGLVVGKLSVMSLGFAAIVLGIVVDYAVLIIQEAKKHADATADQVRRLAAPGIIAGGVSTAVVFLSLMMSGLPGLRELGLLVALGVLTGLVVMLVFAPRFAAQKEAPLVLPAVHHEARWSRVAVVLTLMVLLGAPLVLLTLGLPRMETGADALRPTSSEAMEVFEWVQHRLGRSEEASVPVLVSGPATELKARTEALAALLGDAGLRHAVPMMLVPDGAAQVENLAVLKWLVAEAPRLEQAAERVGYTSAAMSLLRGLVMQWKAALDGPWPQSAEVSAADPILARLLAHGERALAAGLPAGEGAVLASVNVAGRPGRPNAEALADLQTRLEQAPGVRLAGWEAMGGALSAMVNQDLRRQLIPVLLVLVVTLLITFRSATDLVLSILMLGAGLAGLAATMTLCGVGWNLASLAAIPLLLGTGLDYGIHILLAMQRSGNQIALVRATTGKAVFFSGMTTVIGFGSLLFAGNRGIASLGLACCVGTLWILFVVVVLLPHWRQWLSRPR